MNPIERNQISRPIPSKQTGEDPMRPIDHQWKRFIEGLPPEGPLRSVILKSWQRSRDYGIDPMPNQLALHPISQEDLQRRVDLNRELVDIASLHLSWISSSLAQIHNVLFLVDRDGIVLYATGNDSRMREAFHVLPGYDWSERNMGTNAAGTALSENQAIAVAGPEHFIQLFHGYTCTGVPIHASGSVVGAIGIGTPVADGNPERMILTAHTAYVVEQELMHRQIERQAESMKAEAMTLLANALDYKTILSSIAHLVVPRFADGCLIDMLEEDQSIVRLAVSQADPSQKALASELQRDPIDPGVSHGAPRVILTGQSELYPEISDFLLQESAFDAAHLKLLRQIDSKSAMVVPITGRGRVLGAITFASEASGRYSRVDLALAEDLARRAALAIENAQLYGAAQREIAERKRAQEALRRSEERFRQISESGILSVAFFDLSGRVTDANEAFLKMIGYTREALLEGKVRWDRLTPPEWRERTAQAIQELKIQGRCTPYEKEYFRKDGTRFWGLFGGAMLNGGEEGVAFVVDIAERKRAEASLRQSEEKYRNLFETMAQGVVYQDAEGKIISANPAAERILGLTLDQMQGRNSFDFSWRAIHVDRSDFRGEDHPAMIALKTGEEVKNAVMGIFHPVEKGYRWININATPKFRSGEEKPYQVYSTFSDITERKQAEEALRRSEGQLQAILDHTTAVVYLMDLDDRFMMVNRQFETLHLKKEAVYGKSLHDLFPKEVADALRANNRKVVEAGRPLEFDEVVPQEDGTHVYLSIKVPLLDHKGNPYAVCGISSDITDRKRMEETLGKKTVEAEEANRAKSQFVSMVSHELRTPLNAILGYTELLGRSQFAEDPVKRAEMIDRIYYNAQSLLQLINNLLHLNRLEAGQMPVKDETVYLHDMVRKIVYRLEPMGEEKGLKVSLVDDCGPLPIHSDPKKIEQIITNLISNAIKFTDRGSVTIRLSDLPAEQHVAVEVSDTGIGIAEKDFSRLFEPFYQADPSDTRSYEGSGLGLSIVKKFAELLGGTVRVESTVGAGTTFTVRLPYENVRLRSSAA